MAARAYALGVRRRGGTSLGIALGLTAAVVGGLAVSKPFYAIGIVLAVGIALLVAADVTLLPRFLVFTMFVESVALGPGLRIGRVAGALALVVVALYLLARPRSGLRPSALLAAAGAYGAWTLASAFWADSSSLVYTNVFSYLLSFAYTIAFATLVRSGRQVVGILRAFAVGSLVFGVVGVATYLASSGTARASGLQGDPNFFAVYQVVALPAALALAARERRPLRRLFLFAVVFVIVLSIVASQSRTGLVALAVVVVATLVLPSRFFFGAPARKLSYVLGLAATAGVATVIASASVLQRVQSIFEGGSAADRGSGRTDLWSAAWHGYVHHPWLGLGSGNFQAHALDLLQTTPGVNTRASYVAAGRVVHNAYLEVLVELGPIGLGLFLLLLVLSARYLVVAARRARRSGDVVLERSALAVLLGLLGVSVGAFFLSNELGRAFWIVFGLALALDVMTRAAPARPAAAGAPAAPDYDPAVADQLVRLEQRVVERLDAVRAEQARLRRRQSALASLEQDMRRRHRELAGPTARGEPWRRELERLLERVASVESGQDESLRRVARELAQREESLRKLDESAALREQDLRRLEQEHEARLQERERRVAVREESLRRLDDDLRARREQIGNAESLRRALTDAAAIREALRTELSDLKRERDEALGSLHDATAELRERIDVLEREREDAHVAARRFARELETLREHVPAAEAERDEARAAALAAKDDLRKLRERVRKLEAERKHARSATGAAEAELARLRPLVRGLTRERNQALATARAATSALSELRGRVDGLERERDETSAAASESELELSTLRKRAAEVEELRGRVHALTVERDRAVARTTDTAERLEERLAAVAERERELVRRVGLIGTAATPAGEDDAAAAPGAYRLETLERLVGERGREFPDRIDEWQQYLFFLRAHAGAGGRLPDRFDALVEEVFGELLA